MRHVKTVKMLLEMNADVEKFDLINHQSTVMIADRNRDLKIVHLLLKYSADINKTNDKGNTVLIYATMKDNIKVVKLLMKKGADASIANNQNETPLYIENYCRFSEM